MTEVSLCAKHQKRAIFKSTSLTEDYPATYVRNNTKPAQSLDCAGSDFIGNFSYAAIHFFFSDLFKSTCASFSFSPPLVPQSSFLIVIAAWIRVTVRDIP